MKKLFILLLILLTIGMAYSDSLRTNVRQIFDDTFAIYLTVTDKVVNTLLNTQYVEKKIDNKKWSAKE